MTNYSTYKIRLVTFSRFGALIVALLLTGCVTGDYQAYNGGVGYISDHQEDNIYQVTYTGTRTTKAEKVNDFVLLRSAELTLEQGFKYFVIAEATNNKNERRSVDANALADGSRTNYSAAEGGATFGAVGAPSGPIRAMPKSTLVIHMFNDKPESISYDAAIISRALKDEYEIAGDSNS